MELRLLERLIGNLTVDRKRLIIWQQAETLTLTYTIQAMDDSGVGASPTAPDESDTATKTVTITITGTNDSPELTLGSNSGSVNRRQ